MVAAPCLRLAHVARWNGRPPQTTTGAARVSESHCQSVNWRAGTIAIATTGTERIAETTRRVRRSSTVRSPGSAGAVSSAGGAGREAPYPAASTASTSVSVVTPSSYRTVAFSVA